MICDSSFLLFFSSDASRFTACTHSQVQSSTAVKVNFEHILCISMCTMCTLCTLCAHCAHLLCAQCAHENIMCTMCTFFMCTMCTWKGNVHIAHILYVHNVHIKIYVQVHLHMKVDQAKRCDVTWHRRSVANQNVILRHSYGWGIVIIMTMIGVA